VLPALVSLIALQQLDTAAETARKRLAEMPGAEQALQRKLDDAQAAVDRAKTALADNQHARRELEKQVAAVDGRLARFDDHRAAVKTNHEYTALLHEITVARTEKDGIEEQILVLMETADGLQASVRAAERVVAETRVEGEAARKALAAERVQIEVDLSRLTGDRSREASGLDKATLARYEQLLKQRKMVAVAEMRHEVCTACHVRLRPAVSQQVRRNSELVACDSCQRILYYVAPQAASPEAGDATASPTS
jgi:predicted  nucleic acid-binding Zn-ribbon protein